MGCGDEGATGWRARHKEYIFASRLIDCLKHGDQNGQSSRPRRASHEVAGYTCLVQLAANLSHDVAAKVPVLSLTVLVVPFSLTLEMPASREDSLEYI